MAAPTPFKFDFGAGANFNFENKSAAPAYPDDSQQKIEDLEVENAILQNKIDAALEREKAALEQNRCLGAERDTAKEAEITARNDFKQLSDEWNTHTAMAASEFDQLAEYERMIVNLQNDLKDSNETIEEQRKDLDNVRGNLSDSKKELADQKKQFDDYRTQAEHLRATSDKLKEEVDHHKTIAETIDRTLNKAYADLRTADGKRLELIEAKDKVEVDNKRWELQFEDLHQQWQEAEARIEALLEQQKEIEQIDAATQGLEADIEHLQDIISDHERTLIVKDERIAHLENQYQKERQRNLNAAAAAAAAAATSPIDEAPPVFSPIGGSLQDEFDDAFEPYGQDDHDAAFEGYDHVEYEHLELSEVTELADIEPTEPAARPDCMIDVTEAASISPITAAVPDLTIMVNEAGSVTPVERQLNTISAGVQTDVPTFTIEHLRDAAFSISPIAPADTPSLTTELLSDATFEISPIAPVDIVTTTTATQTEAPKLTSHIVDEASISVSPVEAEAPKLTSHVVDEASIVTSPVEAEIQELTTHVVDDTSITISPVEARAPKLTSHVIDIASFAITPVVAEAQKLTSRVIDKASIAISPVEAERKPTTSTAPKRTLGDITAVFEEQPVDAPIPTTSTASTAAQTTMTSFEAGSIPTAPRIVTHKPNKITLLQTVLPLVSLLLAICCMYLYIQLDTWRYANGIGYTYSNSGRTGAFGNGRYLFGVIPLAMDVGDSWVEEQFARYVSMAIKGLEDWAGFDYRPLY